MKSYVFKIFSLIKEYCPNSYATSKNFFKLVLFEVFYLIKNYKQNSINIMNHQKFTDNIPTLYYFLHNITKFLKKSDIKSLVDLGCGGGRSIYFFNKKLTINYYGVEFQKKIYNNCKRLFIKFDNIKIYNDDFMSYKFLDFNSDCFFINDPLKNKEDFDNLIINIIDTNNKLKKIIYFVLINVDESKREIFSKYKSIDSFKYKSKGYYIYSNEKIL